MVLSRGLVISLGVSALSATLLFLYFRNRMASVERKVDVMFDLIQSHEKDRQEQISSQMMMMQQSNPSSQNNGAWRTPENVSERNLIDVSEDEDDEEYDSEDSREVSDTDEDIEERIKLVTTDIDETTAEEAKNVVVLEATNDEPVTVNENVELEEVTNNLEDNATSADNVDNNSTLDNSNENRDENVNTQQADVTSEQESDMDDSLEEDSDEEEDITEPEPEPEPATVNYAKLKVTELKAIAEAKGLTNYKSLKKQPLIDLLNQSE